MYLVRLSHICKDCVDHGHQHPVLVRVSSIFDDGNDVSSFLGHVDQVTTRPVGELNRVNHALLQKR